MLDLLPPQPHKGRGAIANPAGRFEGESRAAVDDGWAPDEDLPPLRTIVTEETCRSVISWNDSPDLPFDRSVNPYRGCEHGCIYCYARPSHANVGLSSGLDFETRLFAKANAPEALAAELGRRGYKAGVLMLGANTDAYQPAERDLRLTRRVLEVLAAHRHPVAIVTKSALVLRDLDLLAPMAAAGLVTVAISVTTLDERLARQMEPRAPRPAKRLEAIRSLAEAGIPVGVMAAPMIPALTDHELEAILEAAKEAGATRANATLLRLPYDLKELFTEWLEAHAPGRAGHVLNQLRDHRGGKLNQSDFADRLTGAGVQADLLTQRVKLACRRLGLKERCGAGIGLDATRFRVPSDQMDLFAP